MFKISVCKDLEEAKRLWQRHWPKERLFDLWPVRACFQSQFNYSRFRFRPLCTFPLRTSVKTTTHDVPPVNPAVDRDAHGRASPLPGIPGIPGSFTRQLSEVSIC